VVVLWLITFGIYGLYWQYSTFKEMNEYSGQGVGGVLGLILAVLIAIVNVFLIPAEIGSLYSRENRLAPVTGITGLWIFLPIAGWFVWVVKSQRALNRYWQDHGAVA